MEVVLVVRANHSLAGCPAESGSGGALSGDAQRDLARMRL